MNSVRPPDVDRNRLREGSEDVSEHHQLGDLPDELLRLRDDLLESETQGNALLAGLHQTYADSARNLLHYLALRRADLRPLQERLALFGLSSLGRAEPYVLANLDAVLRTIVQVLQQPPLPLERKTPHVGFSLGKTLLEEHTEALLGAVPQHRRVRIMVTMPSEAADDYALVRELLASGMDCMRINCAHDDPNSWKRMIEHLRRAERESGVTCRVFMDLAGPKLRTGPMTPGPQVVHWATRRDNLGRIVRPAHIWLAADQAPPPAGHEVDAVLPVPVDWLQRRQPGDRVRFKDPHDTARKLLVVDVLPSGCWAESHQAAWVAAGTRLRASSRSGNPKTDDAMVQPLAPLEQEIVLTIRDVLILTGDSQPGTPAVRNSHGQVIQPARISCTLPQVFADLKPGEPIWMDDGKIGGHLETVSEGEVHVRITHARQRGSKLRADKGINFPLSELRLPALTEKDIQDLAFIVHHADAVGYSFVNTPEDVERLQRVLASLYGQRLGILLKIETRRAFVNLPKLLMAAMRNPCVGVMIARGDLGVECGFERLAEVQEEILWICEAAHVPVVWATQVLETLAKKGLPSRAEITDAAMGERAECVMLNKGPHIMAAVRVLDDILQRMAAHQNKKRSMLRPLQLAAQFIP